MKRPMTLPALTFGLTLLALALLPGTGAAASPQPGDAAGWSYDQFLAATHASGRRFSVSREDFSHIQERRAHALASIQNYLAGKFGKADPAVMQAFTELPREYFHYNYAKDEDFARDAYESRAKPWAIGFGSALSDYLGQAYMTQLAQPRAGDVVLEIGTGSGFQIALLSRMVKEAYSIEIVDPLGKGVEKIFAPLKLGNVRTRVGDGYHGWAEVKGGFDIIMVTCAAQYVPPALFAQLKPNGRLLIPIGQPFKRGQFLYVYTKDEQGRIHSRKDVGVFFIPMTGKLLNGQPLPDNAERRRFSGGGIPAAAVKPLG